VAGKICRISALLAVIMSIVVSSSAPAPARVRHAGAAQIIVRVSSNPIVETSSSDVFAIIQIEANPGFANHSVTIASTQLSSHCSHNPGNEVFYGHTAGAALSPNSITVPLDNNGNVTVFVFARDCHPGSDLVEASLNTPPFATAVTRLILKPPQVTPPGVHAFPNPEVETSDGGPGQGPASQVYFLFNVEADPVFAEQNVTIISNELTSRCGLGSQWVGVSGLAGHFALFPGGSTGDNFSSIADNDGNTAFVFIGSSCAAGKSTVIAEILNNGPTFSTQVNILPPAATI
jgi:hypothetical protein